jgi:hypothetical protein
MVLGSFRKHASINTETLQNNTFAPHPQIDRQLK